MCKCSLKESVNSQSGMLMFVDLTSLQRNLLKCDYRYSKSKVCLFVRVSKLHVLCKSIIPLKVQ